MTKLIASSNSNLEQLKNCDELKILAKVIIKIMREFKQEYSEFNMYVSSTFVKELNLEFKNNMSRIRASTGFTKSIVKKALNDKLVETTDYMNKQKFLLAKACTEINNYCYSNKVDEMPKINFYRSMQDFNDGHITISTHLDNLIDKGFIDTKDGYVFVDLESPRKKRSGYEYLGLIVCAIERITSVVTYNKNKNKSDLPLFERRIRSTQISPDNALSFTQKANKLLSEHYNQMKYLIDSNEDNVPPFTYPEIVVQYLFYNQYLIEKNNHEN